MGRFVRAPFTGDTVWNFSLTPVKFGVDAVSEIGYDAKALGGSKVLLITDKQVAKAGLADRVRERLEEQGLKVEVWDEVEPEPSLECVKAGVELAKRVEPDLFVGVGGGSVIDAMKVVDLLVTYGGDVLDYVAPPTGKGRPVPGALKPQIAVPTTAGTGSETSPTAVISLPKEGLKVGISHAYLRPHLAVLDPLMTVTCPPSVTASSGMDALSHAIGAYTTRRFYQRAKPRTPAERPVYGGGTPLTDLLAAEAIKLIGRYLRRAVYHPYDIEARSNMLLAAYYAGVAFTNAGLLVDHALAYPLGGEFHVPHGLAVALLLPAAMEFSLPSSYERFATVASLLGERIDGLSTVEAAYKSVEAVKKLSKDVGIPRGLEAVGVKEEDIPRLAKKTLRIQRLLACSPRPVTEEDIVGMFKKALKNY